MIQLQTLGLLLLCHVLTAENKTYDRGGGGGGGGGEREVLTLVITVVLNRVCKPLSIGLHYTCAQLNNESVT